MLKQAEAEAPIEACGILAGSDSKVEKLYKMTNADKSSDHFMMEPAEQFKVVKDMRSAGLKMLAIYHSHPATPARLCTKTRRVKSCCFMILPLSGLCLQDCFDHQ